MNTYAKARKAALFALLAITLAVAGTVKPATAQSVSPLPAIGAVTGCNPCAAITTGVGQIYNLNIISGQATNPRYVTYQSMHMLDFVGLALASNTHAYGLTGNAAAAPAYAYRLFSIHLASGGAALLGQLKLNNQLYPVHEGDIAVDPTTGKLYGISTNGKLFRVDNLQTGAVTQLGIVPASDASAMAFTKGGTLYVLDTNQNALLKVNKSNGTVDSQVTLTNVPLLSSVAGMSFGGTSAHLYASAGGRLIKINPVTGSVTMISATPTFAGFDGRWIVNDWTP